VARGEADGPRARQPFGLDRGLVVDEVGDGAVALGDLDEAARVRGVRGPDDEHQVRGGGERLDRVLAVLRGVADVAGARAADAREARAQRGDHVVGLVDGEGRLREVGHAVGILDLEPSHVGLVGHDPRALRGLPDGAVDLLVALVADEHDRVAVAREAARLGVDLAHERAGGVDDVEIAGGGGRADGGGDAVGGEHERGAGRYLVDLLDEHRAAALEVGDDVGVVDDLLADVDARAVVLERLLDDLDRALDAGARGPRRRERDRPRTGGAAPGVEDVGRGAQGAERAPGAAGQRERVVQLAGGGVDDGAHDGEGAAGGGAGEPRRLHVAGDGAGGGEPRALVAAHEARGRDDRSLVHGQAAAAQRAGEQRGGRAGDGDAVPTHPADLGGDDEVAGPQSGIERTAEAGDRDGVGGGAGGARGGRASALGAHARALDLRAAAERGGDGACLDAKRCEHEQRHAATACRCAGRARMLRTSFAAV
jgi:hypothetical protein